MFVFLPSLCWQSAAITKKKTNIGAIAFNAPTNKDPSKATGVALGTTKASTVPNISPIIILLTKLILFHFVAKVFIIPSCNFKMSLIKFTITYFYKPLYRKRYLCSISILDHFRQEKLRQNFNHF
ncbi:hypothetical protein SDC9_132417 [bioreactor metagenome]|uniref:Uncharacterized protein n=1 Tax=bioreactor metagenome TaxID=1076179 RepID=A0A645D7Z2_9ZZZZ